MKKFGILVAALMLAFLLLPLGSESACAAQGPDINGDGCVDHSIAIVGLRFNEAFNTELYSFVLIGTLVTGVVIAFRRL